MSDNTVSILNDPVIRVALKRAREDSRPGPTGGQEEGGFILGDSVLQRPKTTLPRAEGGKLWPLH
jgi:hypothetical protein